jgi:hypothetical protein
LKLPVPDEADVHIGGIERSIVSRADLALAVSYDYEISILQAEFSLTQVSDRPLTGRLFFEAAFRENLDLGRPEQVQLISDRRITRRTPARFRTRIITEGVTPALHVDYKHSRIKQYHKEGRALHTETTIHDTRDFYVGKRLKNLPALRQISFQANRRLLNVQLSAMIVSWVKTPFGRSTNRARFPANGWRPCASLTDVCTPCSARWSLFDSRPTGLLVMICRRCLRHSWASAQTNSPRGIWALPFVSPQFLARLIIENDLH